jgi:hypothetical protein
VGARVGGIFRGGVGPEDAFVAVVVVARRGRQRERGGQRRDGHRDHPRADGGDAEHEQGERRGERQVEPALGHSSG